MGLFLKIIYIFLCICF